MSQLAHPHEELVSLHYGHPLDKEVGETFLFIYSLFGNRQIYYFITCASKLLSLLHNAGRAADPARLVFPQKLVQHNTVTRGYVLSSK